MNFEELLLKEETEEQETLERTRNSKALEAFKAHKEFRFLASSAIIRPLIAILPTAYLLDREEPALYTMGITAGMLTVYGIIKQSKKAHQAYIQRKKLLQEALEAEQYLKNF